MTLDINAVRSKFTALQQEQVFMDNAGGSQVLDTVADSISNYLKSTNVQLGATYRVGIESTKLVAEGYAAAAEYINANPSDIVFGGSTTQLFHNLSSALFEHFHQGDEFVLSEIEHEANVASWVRLADRLKLTVKWWRGGENVGSNPVLTAENLKPLLTPKTKFVACTHTSNILGTIHDIASISKVVHDTCPEALLCVDSVAYAPHAPIDVQALGVDFLSFSWYKVYGPHIALLYCSPAGQKALTNLAHYFNQGPSERQNMENKLGLAAYNYEITQSIPKVVEYLSRPGIWDEIGKHEERLQTIILDWLKKDERITIYGQPTGDRTKRVPVVSFTVRGRKSRDIVEEMDKRSNYGMRWGHFYSHRLITKVFGLTEDGVARISLVHYNTEEEVKGVLEILGQILSE